MYNYYHSSFYFYKEILKVIEKTFNTEAIVAGGAIRDVVLNKKSKDIDIYLVAPDGVDPIFVETMLFGAFNETNIELSNLENYQEGKEDYTKQTYASTAIDYVLKGEIRAKFGTPEFNVETKNTKSVDFIFLKEEMRMRPSDYVSSLFCCSLSKVSLNSKQQISYHPEFVDSVKNREITFDFNGGNINYDYIKKICNKYPEYDVDNHTKAYMQREFSRLALESKEIINENEIFKGASSL